MDVEERLKATAPAPPPALKAAILAAAGRRRSGGLLPLAASFLLCAALLYGILPRREGARPGGAQDVERLIARLGDPDLERRESAYRELRELGPGIREALKRASADGDPEIRARAAELLEDVALLPVDRTLRDALNGFCSRRPAAAKEGLGRLLKGERAKVVEALKLLAAEKAPRMRTRAADLLRILARENPLRYGLIPLEASVGPGEPAGAMEIWVNDSGTPILIGGSRGSDVDYFAAGDEAGELMFRAYSVGRREPDDRTGGWIKPGGTAVILWKNLLPPNPRPGRYEIRHYSHVLRPKAPGAELDDEGFQTNLVEVTVGP